MALAVLVVAGCGRGGRTAPAREIHLNSEVTTQLRSTDPRLSDNSVYHLYTFRGAARQFIQIDVMSQDFDAFAYLQDAAGNELARDDDDGDGLDARIRYTLPASGTYRILANSYSPDHYGTYTVRLTALTGRPGSEIQRGARVTGRLRETDARLADNSVFHYYLYRGEAGERITVEVMSDDFDAYGMIQDHRGNRLEGDDDSGEGLNARIRFALPYTGTYRIIVNTYAANSFGAYTLWVH